MCFDNIRKLRTDGRLPQNNDAQLGEMFDQELNNLMTNLTDAVADKQNNENDKKRVAIEGKRYLMSLLSDRFAEFMKFKEPQCEQVFSDLVTQYDTLIDQSLNINDEQRSQMGNSKGKPKDSKDKEIQRL